MENKIPFTTYDFWAYLSSGFLLLFAVDHVAGTHLLARDAWTVVQSIIAISSAYAVGHVTASMSSFFLEKLLVGRLLGFPRDVLFGKVKAPRWLRFLLASYFQSLPKPTQLAVIEKGKGIGVHTPGEALFWPAYIAAICTPSVSARIDNFLNLYGFCRNTAFVAFVNAALLFWSYQWGGGARTDLGWACASLALGSGLTLRYLKFLRHYASEIFTSFAYSKVPDKAK